MSRAPPFPTPNRRPANGNGSRTRPTTPEYDYPPSGGPARPSRSDLRPQGLSANGSGNRDSIGTTYSEPPRQMMRRERDRDMEQDRDRGDRGERRERGNRGERERTRDPQYRERDQREGDRERTRERDRGDRDREKERERLQTGEEEPTVTSPRAISSALAAFQRAAGRPKIDEAELKERRQREKEEQDRRQRIREREPGRKRTKAVGEIDAILNEIQEEWEFVIDPDFNPVDLALSLLDDSSSVGKSLDSFRRTKKMLERALKGTVDKHYQSFAAALPHHASVINSLTASQAQVVDARTRLQDAAEALGTKRADLIQLWTRGQSLEEMTKILDEIEHLKSVQDTLESLILEKKLLQASVLLIRSIKTISKSDMQDIGALADLRSYLTGQENSLREIIIDELHSHLYLKNYWTETRWAAYTTGQQMLPVVEFDETPSDPATSAIPAFLRPPATAKPRLTRFLTDLGLRANDPPPEVSAMRDAGTAFLGHSFTSRVDNSGVAAPSPEADSFTYIETLLESLAVLGKLGSGLDAVSQRLPIEIYALVECTIEEVSERAEFGKRMTILSPATVAASTGGRPSSAYIITESSALKSKPGDRVAAASALRLAALESSSKESDHEVLKDFFWTLYSKMDAVMQGLRVVYEIANRIGSRRDFKDSSGAKPGTLFPLMDIWMPLQSEIRMLLHDYLNDQDRGSTSSRNPIASINEVLREGRFGRDRTKNVYRFGDSDAIFINKLLKKHEDELTRILKENVPGLVQASAAADSALGTTSLSTLGLDHNLGTANQHRPLIRPDPFHVSVLFQPTLALLDRISTEILPPGMGESARATNTFLEEFVLSVYLPLLKDRVTELFQHAVNAPDAFQDDPSYKLLSAHPLCKASTQVLSLINSLCAMLQTTPFHRENYSRLILEITIQFYQRCSDRFRELVSSKEETKTHKESHIAVAARWAQKPEVGACLNAMYYTAEHETNKIRKLCRQETRVELNFLTKETVTKEDLIRSTKNLASLSSLYQSLMWFIKQLNALKTVSDDPSSPTNDPPGSAFPPMTAVTAAQPHFPTVPTADPDEIRLPLTRAMALSFDSLVKTFEQLAELILCTIRIDIRCRTIHFLDLAMQKGNYRVERDAGEPDPHIIDLNTDLGACDDCTASTLPPRERKFIFDGLGTLMEHLLIANSRHIRFANEVGIQKIMRNMLALQQNLKTITEVSQDADFERAKKYWALFSFSPSEMLNSIRDKPLFTFDEYKSMLNFKCGVDQALGDRGASQATDRDYNMYLIDLHALAIGDWDE